MSARRYELTDFEWSIIKPLLPDKPRGVARADDRKVLNGIYWRLRTGSPWADIPSAMDHPPPATTASCAGGSLAFGTKFSTPFPRLTTAICKCWIVPRSACTSMRPMSKKGLRRSGRLRWG